MQFFVDVATLPVNTGKEWKKRLVVIRVLIAALFPVDYPQFSLREEIARIRAGENPSYSPPTYHRFDDAVPRSGRDRDGILIWIHIPHAIRDRALVRR